MFAKKLSNFPVHFSHTLPIAVFFLIVFNQGVCKWTLYSALTTIVVVEVVVVVVVVVVMAMFEEGRERGL